YTLTVLNKGPSAASNVVLTDTLPAGVTYQSSASSQGPVSLSGNTVTATLGDLAGGASANVTIVVQTSATGSMLNTASVLADQADSDSSRNSANRSTNVVPAADLDVSVAVPQAPVNQGSMVTYTVTVKNKGPSPASAIVLHDTIPPGTAYQSSSASQG